MPLYEFACAHCAAFDASFSMADVPSTVSCPTCGAPAPRRMTAPRLSKMASAEFGLIDRAARSADAPEVVTGPLPGARTGPKQRYTMNPLHRKLPRP